MTSDPKEILDWIESRYGKPTTYHANGVFVVAVRDFGGISMGMGSSQAQALYDLYCDLTGITQQKLFSRPPNVRRWELERRKRIDQEFLKQYSGVKK